MSPSSTVYTNARFLPALPPASYMANRSVPSSIFSAIDGALSPVTVTFSSNEAVMVIFEPMPYVPFAFGDETDSTIGPAVSGTMLLALLSESDEPGAGSPRSTALPSRSVMAPRDTRAPACAYSKPAAVGAASPGITV